MANDAGIGAISSILQLLNAQNQQTQAQDTRLQSAVFSDFEKDIDMTFDNSRIDTIVSRMENYYNQNFNNMSPTMIETYEHLLEKSKFQKEDNSKFNVLYSQIDGQTQNMMNLLNSYNEVDESLKSSIAKKMESNIVEFVKSKNSIFRKFGSRLTRPEYAPELTQLSSLDDIFRFGIKAATDDNYFSPEEYNVFSNAVLEGDMSFIDDYVTKETKYKQGVASTFLDRGLKKIENINTLAELPNLRKQAVEIKENQANTWENIKNQIIYSYESGGTKTDVTWNDLFSPTIQSLALNNEEQIEALSKSLNKDNFQYNKITGNNIQDFATIDWDIPSVANVEPPVGTITGINIGNKNKTILDGTINQNVVETPTISLGDDDDIYGTTEATEKDLMPKVKKVEPVNEDIERLNEIELWLKENPEIKSPKSQEEAKKMYSQRNKRISLLKERDKIKTKLRRDEFIKKAMELSGIKDIGELSKDIKNNPSKYTKLISK
tara:strand:- start:8828 stop:10303 length:1476 start_codon:yes stop_codon:yes gene_type:complete